MTLSHVKENRYLKTVVHQIGRKKRLLFSPKFTVKLHLVVILAQEKTSSYRFRFKAHSTRIDYFKKGTPDYQNSTMFEKSQCF